MSDDGTKVSEKARKAAARAERLAEALRANMKRRKAQARARLESVPDKVRQDGPKDS